MAQNRNQQTQIDLRKSSAPRRHGEMVPEMNAVFGLGAWLCVALPKYIRELPSATKPPGSARDAGIRGPRAMENDISLSMA